jgi:hypothetical protein
MAGTNQAMTLHSGHSCLPTQTTAIAIRALDFFRASRIFRAAEGGKEELKLTLEERMKAHGTA